MPIDPEPPDLPTDSDHVDFSSTSTDAVIAAAIAAGGASASGHHGPVHTHCENCGTKLQGPFCHKCGQHDFEVHRSFGHVFHEALETFFHFEGRFFRNIVILLFRPGRLTADFNAGKRAAQMPPLRLYVFVSVLFFFLQFLGGAKTASTILNDTADKDTDTEEAVIDTKEIKEGIAEATAAARARRAEARARKAEARKAAKLADESATDAPAAGAKKPTATKSKNAIVVDAGDNAEVSKWIAKHAEDIDSAEYRKRFGEAFAHSIPRLLLICLPVFALMTRLLFWRSGQLYLQHLVLALHFHAFVYLWLMFRDGWVFLLKFLSPGLGSLVWGLCMLWVMAYPAIMLRNLFKNSWKRTLVKTTALVFGYSLTLGTAFLVAVAVIFATL